jgi:hypothetical protein
MTNIQHLTLLSYLFIALTSAGLFAEEPDEGYAYDPVSKSVVPKFMGKVSLVKGTVIVTHANMEKEELKKDDKISPGDSIETSEKSFIKIAMVDTSVVTLGPESVFKVEKFVYRTKSDREALFNLLKGQLRTEVNIKAPSPDAIKVKSHQVSLGVRGTDFFVNAQLNAAGERVVEVALLKGLVGIEDKASAREFALSPQEHYISIASPGKAPRHEHKALQWNPSDPGGAEGDWRVQQLLPYAKTAEVSSTPLKQKNKFDRAPASLGSIEAEEEESSSTRSWRHTLDELNRRRKDYIDN